MTKGIFKLGSIVGLLVVLALVPLTSSCAREVASPKVAPPKVAAAEKSPVQQEAPWLVAPREPDITKSALLIVDVQNDFAHKDGYMGRLAKANPELIDIEFLGSVVPNIARLADAFRAAGRPVIYIAAVPRADYKDISFAWYKFPTPVAQKFCVEGTWGAQIVDELKPKEGEPLIIKTSFGAFNGTRLAFVLRNLGINTLVVEGLTTCVCVSTTVREGQGEGYQMIMVSDGTAEVRKDAWRAELWDIAWAFGQVKTTDEVIAMLKGMK